MFWKKDKESRVVSRNGNAPSILSANLRVAGNLTTDGEMQVDGVIEGDVSAGRITIGETATVTGNISAESVTVQGEVRGTIRARTVQLARSAKVTGDIWHETLSIEAGAYYEGQCKHTDKPREANEHSPSLPESARSFLQKAAG